MSKLKRCAALGCRTLTDRGLCDACAAEKPPVPVVIDERRARLAVLQAGDALSRQWAARADKIDALRADLRALREQGERSERHAEQPVFSEER